MMSNPYQSPESMSTNANSGQWMAQTHLDTNAAATAVEGYFLCEGYRLEDGNAYDAVYGIGNNLMRILFGAFVKRFKFKVRVAAGGSGSVVTVEKAMSGMMGGAIGYSKMKKELARVRVGVRQAVS